MEIQIILTQVFAIVALPVIIMLVHREQNLKQRALVRVRARQADFRRKIK